MLTKLQIKEYRKKGLTFDAIGRKQKPQITGERIRQILNPIQMRLCKKHRIRFENLCAYCRIESVYPLILTGIAVKGQKALQEEFKRLGNYNRTKEVVIQRAILVKYLKDIIGMTLTQVSRDLGRNYTSIKSLYQKKI